MCGHVGVFGTITAKLTSLFEDMLNMDMVRGYDGTGVCFVNHSKHVSSVKIAALPYVLFRTKEYHTRINQGNIMLMGHNRAATKGAINNDNTHPFNEGVITLAHNGTLRGQNRLPDFKDYDNDSHNIAHAVNKLGIEEAWKLVDGAATCVFWDSKQKRLSFISNMERPFHYCYVNNGSAMVWSSDRALLEAALERRDIKIHKKDVYILKNDHLHQFFVDNKGRLTTIDARRLQAFSYPVVHVNRGTQDNRWQEELDVMYGDGGGRNGSRDRMRPVVNTTVFRNGRWVDKNSGEVDGTIGNVTPLRNSTMSKEEFDNRYPQCVFCRNTLEAEQLTCVIIDESSAACESCQEIGLESGVQLKSAVG